VSGAPAGLRCSAFLAVSLDGYLAREGGGLDWLDRVQVAGEDYGFARFLAGVDVLVMGRATWDVACGFQPWPYAGKRVVVLTHRPPGRAPHGESFRAGEPGELLAGLAAEGVRHAYVDGGAVVRQFLAAGRLDALTLSVVPVVLGAGIRLFPGGEGEHGLELVRAQSWSSGLVQLEYRPAR
jgi:dihydrofolate reductase